MESVVGFLLLFPIFMAAVVVHEVSHGWVALALGDRTALAAGRLTLNPFKHMDPIGTVALPLMLTLIRSPFVFGWAKPVPVNFMNLRRPKRDMLWVGAAGPAANFTLAAAVAFLLRGLGSALPLWAIGAAKYLILINLILGVFNLIPIPPLDGSRILTGLLPSRFAREVLLLERWGTVLVVILLLMGLLDRVLLPAVSFLARLLGIS
ncbi:MAG: site-2 protease family protein [Candidatus Omnitrophica bacterium]|nr:site-2 protease family protein [Candidatus Omnitrophota bacterium]